MTALVFAVFALTFGVLCAACDKDETFSRVVFLLASGLWMGLALGALR